jgi:apolipoprotein N-acyltransferase
MALGSGSLRRAFLLGLTTGVVYFTGTLYWITRVMVVYGGLQTWVAVLVNALLIAYLALFPAVFALVVRHSVTRLGSTALLASPLVWVATELGRAHLFSGFPWVLLGYSQAGVLPIAQLASLAGVYGVSALVAGGSACVAAVLMSPAERTGSRSQISNQAGRYAPLLVLLALIAVIAGWGRFRIARGELTRAGEQVRVGLVQGNVDQAEKWDPARAAAIFQSYLSMTRQAVDGGAAIVLWPESSTPFHFAEQPEQAARVRALARDAKVPILIGSDEIERGVPTRYYNSAFLLRPDGTDAGVYRKMHLVPFGEYVPLKRVLFFAAPLVEAAGDFSPGDSAVLLPNDGHLISAAICYEIVYPDLVRRFVVAGSELLTTITNDAWFGTTSAPYQHFAQASMRAIENGRYLVRAANTGISGVVDPYGRIVARSELYEPAVIVSDARYLRASTFYVRTGDGFAYVSVVATLAMLVVARRKH